MSNASIKNRLLTWADDQQELDEGLSNLLTRLCHFADAECCVWAAVSTLSELTRKSERTVQYRLRQLEAGGYLKATGRTHRLAGSTRSVPVYQLAPEVEGLGLPAPAMGAKAAPIQSHGCKTDGGMGATACTRKEPMEPRFEEANAPSNGAGARERSSPEGFEEGLAAYPASGMARTDVVAAEGLWAAALAEISAEALVTCIRCFDADPVLRKGDHGAPGFHIWLRRQAWRGYRDRALALRAAGQAGPPVETGGRKAFAGPAELRAQAAIDHGEKACVSWLDPSGWDGERRVLTPRTHMAADWLRKNLAGVLSAHGVALGERGQ